MFCFFNIDDDKYKLIKEEKKKNVKLKSDTTNSLLVERKTMKY